MSQPLGVALLVSDKRQNYIMSSDLADYEPKSTPNNSTDLRLFKLANTNVPNAIIHGVMIQLVSMKTSKDKSKPSTNETATKQQSCFRLEN